MAVIVPTCLCPTDSPVQSLAKINNNLSALFFLMSAATFRGNTVNFGTCLCSEAQILATINNNIAGFFTWFADTGGLPNGVKAATVDLTMGDASKAVVFSSAFSSVPSVVAVVVAPDNSGSVISLSPDNSTVTAAGFTVLFGGAIPAAGYKLMYIASPAA